MQPADEDSSEEQVLSRIASTRLTPHLYAFVDSEAERLGVTRSEYLRLVTAKTFLEKRQAFLRDLRRGEL